MRPVKRWKLSILLMFLVMNMTTSVDTRASSSQVQLNPTCGRWLIVQVYAGAFTFPAKAILPDGAANPYIVYGGPDLVVDNYYCIYDPVVELISPPDRTKEGYTISQKITGWSTIQPAGGQPPSAEFDAWPQSGSAPLSVSMHIVSTNNISSCLWEYGDGTTGTSCDPYHDHVYTSAGSYTVKLTVTGPGGSNTMTRSNYITATAAAVCYTLNKNVNPSNSGSIIAFPIPNCADGKYAAGTQLSLVATPLSGYQFTSWSGSLSGNANPATLIMDTDKSVTATFSQSSFCSAVTEIPQTECEALIALYNNTNGAGWSDNSNWLDTTSPCSWFGVTCSNNHIIQLELPNNQLNGTLPQQLSALSNLQILSLYLNQISGPIPPEVGNLTNLIWLLLSDNQLNGSIPTNLGSLSNLQLLHVHGNQLNGNIPIQLGNLGNLAELDLARNQLSGSIPVQLGNLNTLEKLSLDSNQLSGNIPSEISKLTKLVGINLSNNQLSGNLPNQMGDLVNLDFLYIENNSLSGALPGSLTNLNKLVHFWFNNTNLCEPGDNSFQSWLTRISDLNRTGVICTAPSTITPTPTRTPSPTATLTPTPTATRVDFCADMDGDSLCDEWELHGYNGVDLPAMGASKGRKDIFVHVDWLEESAVLGHSHYPGNSLDKVVEAFANAPVGNPDGSTGIKLHIIWGQAIEETNENSEMGFVINGCDYSWTEFADLKKNYFPAARWPIFHYVIFGHHMPNFNCGMNGRPSGISRTGADFETGASDFIVALGAWEVLPGFTNIRAGTFMHELGHNLGLGHGGLEIAANGDVLGVSHIGYKPNHLSVMNYSFQTRGLRKKGALGFYTEGHMDYSRFGSDVLADLDETNLSEPNGMSASDLVKNFGTRYYCQGTNQTRTLDGLQQAVDWNCDNDKTDTKLNTNVNRNRSSETLTSANEWTHLVYDGGTVGDLGILPDLPATTSMADAPEITFEEDTQIGPYNSDSQLFLPIIAAQ